MQQSMSGAPDLVTYLVSSGVSGLILFDVCVTRKVVVPKWIYDRECEERTRERGEKDVVIAEQKGTIGRLTDLAEQQVIPALTRATELNKDYLKALQERRRDA